MKTLRRAVLANALLLAAAGVTIAFNPPLSLPVRYAVGDPYQSLVLIHVVAIALAGSALALLLQGLGSLVGEVRRLALGLSLANGLIAFMFLAEQVAFDGDWVGWVLMLIALTMAAALVWLARRPLRPGEVEAEIAALKIPDEIRQGLLRQTAEAAAQEERNRLARDLHDSIKQQLFSINVGTAAAQERWERDPEGARKALADVRRSAREAMVEMQAMLHQLRPEALGMAGLIEALREQCEALGYRTGAEVALELGEPVPEDRVPPGTPETLFRMAQEMLSNVARHARARRARLWLGREEDAVILRIEDDGRGFDPATETAGMGLRNLRERVAALRGAVEIASTPGTGTGVSVCVPLLPPSGPRPVDLARVGFRQTVLTLGCLLALFVTWHATSLEESVLKGSLSPLLLMVPMLFYVWVRWGRRPELPLNVREYRKQQGAVLGMVFLGWWVCAMDSGRPSHALSFTVLVLCLLARGWMDLHRASEVRHFWRPEARIWLGPLLAFEAAVLLVLGLSLFAPGRLALSPLEALFLLLAGIAFAYVASRQPRAAGAPS
jgi:signal transduction histidine kinase